MFTRTKPAATPAQLQDQLRTAQAEHEAAIADANQRLIESHDAIMVESVNRQKAIAEQIDLLTAEYDALKPVVESAMSPKVPAVQ